MPQTVILFDVDSRIPNLALMKLSTWYKARGARVILHKKPEKVAGDRFYASCTFFRESSAKKVDALRAIYGDDILIGGTGVDLKRRLPVNIETLFPDYSLYEHRAFALGFLTRGCQKRCPFCVVPFKEGRHKTSDTDFAAFVPNGWNKVMLLDDNLLSAANVIDLLNEMVARELRVNFSQTLDIAYLTEDIYRVLANVASRNARFTRKRIYFSCNHPGTIKQFEKRRDMLKSFGEDGVSVVAMYGFDTSLSQDFARWRMFQRFRLVPFFQEYWPIEGVPERLPKLFFDMDLDRVMRMTFRSNGQNWEKYLRWLNRRYFQTFGRYYRPLLEIIYRYNNKRSIRRYLNRPQLLTKRLYHHYTD